MLEIRQSHGKGRGIFSSQRIPKDTVVLSEAPLFALEQPMAIRIYRESMALPLDIKQEYIGLTIREDDDKRTQRRESSHRKPALKYQHRAKSSEPSRLERYATAIRNFKTGKDGLDDLGVIEAARIVAIFHNNAFTLRNTSDTRLMLGLFLQEARMNHSCLANTICAWNQELGKRTVQAIRDIEAGEEITKSYIDLYGDQEARMQLLRNQCGFTCSCVACSSESTVQGHASS